MQATGMRVTCDLRISVFSHLQKLSLKFYEERQTGRIVARVTQDAASMNQLVTGSSVTILGDLTMAAGVFVLLFFLNWRLAARRRHLRARFLSLTISGTAAACAWKAAATSATGIASWAFSTNASPITASSAPSPPRTTRKTFSAAASRPTTTTTTASCGATPSWAPPPISSPASAPSASRDTAPTSSCKTGFTTGELFAFLGYLGLLYGPIVRVFDANVVIQKGVTAMEKIFAILDTRPHIPENDALPEFPRIKGQVEFRDVSFSYRIGQATLTNVSFKVEPGEMVALVGPSGAGKSTIITLLARFYDPSAGRVLIDDLTMAEHNVQSIRRQIGIVMQDNILFSGTIADNIRYGRPGATQAEIIAAAQAANAHDFITDLRHGYDSRVGERGVSLSGGQRQRVAIARVLLKDPRILILDEATSALDSQAEKLIQEATEKLMRNRTAIVIAHRLSTVVNANRILVMDQGRIVATGRHAELLACPGIYRDLYQLQFAERAAA